MGKYGFYKIFGKLLILVIVLSMLPATNLSAVVDGYGKNGKFLAPIEAPDPTAIKIRTAAELDDIRNKGLAGSYVLMNDIDLAAYKDGKWEPIGNSESNAFTGIFDGQGYVIENLQVTGDTYRYSGLFGYANASSIKNVGLIDAEINSNFFYDSYVGGICGYNTGSIANCFNIGTISNHAEGSPIIGGICGISMGTISNCYNIGYISAFSHFNPSYAGGICGEAFGAILKCYNTGSISATSGPTEYSVACFAGGITGSFGSGIISGCYNMGNITADPEPFASSAAVGGICGEFSSGTISNSYNAGNISSTATFGSSLAGGICGYSSSIDFKYISNCVVLSKQISAITNRYIIGPISSKNNNLVLEGITGDPVNDATRSISLAEAKDQETYKALGWDFEDIWYMVPGCDYPQLRGMPLEPDNEYTVTFAAGRHGTMDPSSAREEVVHGETVKDVPEIEADTGYVSIGWYSSFGGIYDKEAVGLYSITRDITFTAVYTDSANATVIFDYKGGTAKEIEPNREIDPDKETVPDREVDSDYVSGRPDSSYDVPAPKRTGYIHIGWQEGIPNGIFGKAESIIKYSAKWAALVNTVTFDEGIHGTIISEERNQSVLYADSVSYVPVIKADSGYVFLGWESNFGGIYDSEAVKSYPIIRDITFTARYASLSKATVIFDYDGGAVGSDTIKYYIGEPGEKYDKPTPTKIGYTLDGWSPEEPGGIFGDRGSSMVYKAKWKANIYTVTFQAGVNGIIETAAENKEVSYKVEFEGSVEKVPPITADSGYTFPDSWSTNGGSPYYSSEAILGLAIIGDTVFTAQYRSLTPPGGSGGSGSATATLTVKGVDKTSNSTIYNQSTTVLVGETEIVPAPIIKGYALDKDSPTSQSIAIKTGSNTVTFYYIYTMGEPEGAAGREGSGERTGQQGRAPAGTKVKETLETEEHIRYLNGYPDGSVRPGGNITRAEVALIFWRLLKDPAKNDSISSRFRDIKDDEIYTQAVNYLAKIGILHGYKDGSFKPWAAISRVEFVAIAGRFDDLASGMDNPFKDVPEDYWAYGYILSAYQKGWIEGYPGGEFRPQSSINRAEAVKIVNCMLGRGIQLADLPEDVPSYTDLARTHWAYCEIMEASCDHEFERKEDGWERWREEHVIGNR